MAKDVLRAAEERIGELDREKAELVNFMRTYRKLAGETTANKVPMQSEYTAFTNPRSHMSVESARESRTARTVRQARQFVEEEGRPIPLGDMARRLQQIGFVFPGKNPVNTLGARLSNSNDIISLKGFGWWLPERPFAAAGYTPPENDPADEPVGSSAGGSANSHQAVSSSREQEVVHDNMI